MIDNSTWRKHTTARLRTGRRFSRDHHLTSSSLSPRLKASLRDITWLSNSQLTSASLKKLTCAKLLKNFENHSPISMSSLDTLRFKTHLCRNSYEVYGCITSVISTHSNANHFFTEGSTALTTAQLCQARVRNTKEGYSKLTQSFIFMCRYMVWVWTKKSTRHEAIQRRMTLPILVLALRVWLMSWKVPS